MKKKWFTVSRNPIGFLGHASSVHVEPGKVAGELHVKAINERQAAKMIGGVKVGKRIAKGYVPKGLF